MIFSGASGSESMDTAECFFPVSRQECSSPFLRILFNPRREKEKMSLKSQHFETVREAYLAHVSVAVEKIFTRRMSLDRK